MTTPFTAPDFGALAAQYEQDGYVLGPVVIPADLLRRAHAGMDAVMAGVYETGKAPLDNWWRAGDDPNKRLRKIDQPHLANEAIHDLVASPQLGEAVARIVGAAMVQVWAVQLLHKPAGGDPQGTVGWHQDYQYWQTWWTPDSQVFTAWVAVSDVLDESGPMCFVAGSHRWGLIDDGDFFGTALDQQRTTLKGLPEGAVWKEAPATMPAGAFSVHHRLTLHGSRPNTAMAPRRSFAIHLRTEKSTPTPATDVDPTGPGHYDYVSFLHDHRICPVMYQA
jgi:hypothetical protein